MRVRRCCVGKVLYMLKSVMLTGLEWSYDVRWAYI